MQADKKTNNASPSTSPVPPPNAEIVALTSQIEPLRTKAERLDTANVALLYLAGAVAVAIAVFGFWSSRVNRNLRGLEATLSKAKDAQLELNLKDKDADIAETGAKAAAANERAANADEEAAKANVRAGNLEIEAATQRERAAKAEADLLELQERIEPRHLSAQQKDAFLEELKKHPVSEIKLLCAVGSEESWDFGREFLDLFKAAGWTVKDNEVSRAAVQKPQPGVAFFIPSLETVPTTQPGISWARFEEELVPRLIAITEAFKAIELDARYVHDVGKKPADGIAIFFGPKP